MLRVANGNLLLNLRVWSIYMDPFGEYESNRAEHGPIGVSLISKFSETARSLLKLASGTLAIRVAGAGIAFLTQIVLARLMGLEEYGIYAFAMVWIIVGGQIGSLGFGEAATKFLAQYEADGESSLARGFDKISTTFLMLTNVAVISAIGLTVWFGAGWIEPAYFAPILISLATIPVLAYLDLLEGKALAFSWNIVAFGPSYVGRQGISLVFILLLVLSGFELTASLALWAMFGGTVLSTLYQHIIISRRLNEKFDGGEYSRDWPAWRKTVVPVAFREAVHVIGRNVDVIIIGLFLSAESMALYFAATRLTGVLSLFHFSFTTSALSRFATQTTTRDKAGLLHLVKNSTVMIFGATGVGYVMLLMFGYPMLALFGEGFSDAYPVLAILGLGTLAFASMGASEDILLMHEHADKTLITQIAAVVTTIILSLLLLPNFGYVGAAISMASGMLVSAIMLDQFLRRDVGISASIVSLNQTQTTT